MLSMQTGYSKRRLQMAPSKRMEDVPLLEGCHEGRGDGVDLTRSDEETIVNYVREAEEVRGWSRAFSARLDSFAPSESLAIDHISQSMLSRIPELKSVHLRGMLLLFGHPFLRDLVDSNRKSMEETFQRLERRLQAGTDNGPFRLVSTENPLGTTKVEIPESAGSECYEDARKLSRGGGGVENAEDYCPDTHFLPYPHPIDSKTRDSLEDASYATERGMFVSATGPIFNSHNVRL